MIEGYGIIHLTDTDTIMLIITNADADTDIIQYPSNWYRYQYEENEFTDNDTNFKSFKIPITNNRLKKY